MVIDVILLSPSCPLFAIPPLQPLIATIPLQGCEPTQHSSLPSCLLTSEGSDVIMKGAGALIWLLWNFMLPVFRTA